MSKKKKKQENPKKKNKISPMQFGIIGILLLGLAGGMVFWNMPSDEDLDLTAIGKGENIVVQVHDPN